MLRHRMVIERQNITFQAPVCGKPQRKRLHIATRYVSYWKTKKCKSTEKLLLRQDYLVYSLPLFTFSLPCLHSAPSGTLITTVVVNRNFHTRLRQGHGMWQAELHVAYVHPTLYPLALIISPYGKDASRLVVNISRMVKVFR